MKTKKIASLIIDDERLARVSLRKKLTPFPEIEIAGEAQSIATAIKAIKELNPDLLFLDIQLSDGNGFELLEKIAFKGKVVFVTAYDEHAIRAFEVNALDYLLKPVSETRLKNLVKRLSEEDTEKESKTITSFDINDRIMVEQKGFIHFIQVRDIMLITSAKDYTVLVTADNKKYIVLIPMNEWEQKLPDEHFFRAHRGYIINFNMIEKTIRIGATAEIYLKDYPKPVKVSRNYYRILRDKYFYK